MQHIIIIGCGDIGRRVAALYRASGAVVGGVVRSPASAALLNEYDIDVYEHDLDSSATLATIPCHNAIVFYFAPPPRQGQQDTRIGHWLASLDKHNLPGKVVLISTTAVYGDSGGDWVTEQTPLAPGTDRGRRRLDAEQRLQAWANEYGVAVVILRVPGIYGPGRLPRRRLENGEPVLREEESGFTNRIHADDLAMICKAAAEKGRAGEVYNVSDGQPGTMTGWFNAVADHLGLPRPAQVTMQQAEQQLSAGILSYLKESRRISNRKMLDELGVKLRYADLQDGLAACGD